MISHMESAIPESGRAQGGRFSQAVDPRRLERLMTVSGVGPTRLAKDAKVGKSTVTRALDGKRLSLPSLLKISVALASYPKNAVIEALLTPEGE
jgi:predicted transcriptional regulator